MTIPYHSNANGYMVPDITYNSPQNRKVRIIGIGAGFSGILTAYRFDRELENIEHVIYEKNPDIGGAWYENRYPGCACDVPSHAYAFNFALNPEWPSLYSSSKDIHAYLSKVTDTFGLRKKMNFNCRVASCVWNASEGKWHLTIERTTETGVETFKDTCDVLVQASGLLNNFKWPEIKGIHDFKGRLIHTANWPEDYQKEQWAQDRVAIIGSGSSSVQTVGAMQPHTKHMDIFVRTPIWFITQKGGNVQYTDEQRKQFREDPKALLNHSKELEASYNALWPSMFRDGEVQKKMKEECMANTAEILKDERLLKNLKPDFAWACRRLTPGETYINAIQQPNVDMNFTHVVEITENSVVGADGTEKEADTIVCATGFDVSFRPAYEIRGERGVLLSEKWKDIPTSYVGVGVPEFPNFITFFAPTWPLAGGSVVGSLNAVASYTISFVKKMQQHLIKSMVPRQDVTDLFNEHTQAALHGMVWGDTCRSWYKNNQTGRVNAIWPGSALHFHEVVQNPRWEDYKIEYLDNMNFWSFLGRGFTVAERTPGSDLAPYLKYEILDPGFYPDSQNKINLEQETTEKQVNAPERLNGAETPNRLEADSDATTPVNGAEEVKESLSQMVSVAEVAV